MSILNWSSNQSAKKLIDIDDLKKIPAFRFPCPHFSLFLRRFISLLLLPPQHPNQASAIPTVQFPTPGTQLPTYQSVQSRILSSRLPADLSSTARGSCKELRVLVGLNCELFVVRGCGLLSGLFLSSPPPICMREL